MGFGKIAAHQVQEMAKQAKAGLTSEADARRNAEQYLNNLNPTDRQEALNELAQKANNR